MGGASCMTSGAGWMVGGIEEDNIIAEVTKVAREWQLQVHNLIVNYPFPARALTTMWEGSRIHFVAQHWDTGDHMLGGFITWIDSAYRGGCPSVQGQYFWMSQMGVRIHISSGLVLWMRAGAIKHGTTSGAVYADDTSVRMGMAFFANNRSVTICKRADEADPNVEAKASKKGVFTVG